MKHIEKKQQAARYHRDLTGVNMAKGLELSQKQRGPLLSAVEYNELEMTAALTVYMVQLHVSGLINDEQAQRRMVDRARKLASQKLGIDLDAEVY